MQQDKRCQKETEKTFLKVVLKVLLLNTHDTETQITDYI
jgi:hypothetical protein